MTENNNKTECQSEIKRLRESVGMNRREFCDYFSIPYRTVTEWERGTRNAPDYLIRLMAYYIKMEKNLNDENKVGSKEKQVAELTASDIHIINEYHSLEAQQQKRLIAYMKALKKLDDLEKLI